MSTPGNQELWDVIQLEWGDQAIGSAVLSYSQNHHVKARADYVPHDVLDRLSVLWGWGVRPQITMQQLYGLAPLPDHVHLLMPADPIDYHAAAVARAATFEQRGTDRNFLACWIPEEQLVKAFEDAMRRHGDPERWWDIDALG